MTNKEHDAIAAEAAENMRGFAYTSLADTDGLQAWRCAKPGTGMWAFDILVTARGAAVVGDIDGLLFQAGHGMETLAKANASYLHSKLEPSCKAKEYDPQRFYSLCLREVRNVLEEFDFELTPEPRELRDLAELQRFQGEVSALVYDGRVPQKAMSKQAACVEFLRGAQQVNDLYDATAFLQRCAGDGVVSSDWYMDGVTLEKPDHFLMVRLNMVSQAAKAIAELRLAATAAPARRSHP
jgi:hypothetical protein